MDPVQTLVVQVVAGVYLAQPLHHPLVGFLVEQGATDDHDVR